MEDPSGTVEGQRTCQGYDPGKIPVRTRGFAVWSRVPAGLMFPIGNRLPFPIGNGVQMSDRRRTKRSFSSGVL
jgi:hypothetical protein